MRWPRSFRVCVFTSKNPREPLILIELTHKRKIVIFGNSASGKSTLAKSISEAIGALHLDLDTLAWCEGVTPPKRRDVSESWNDILPLATNESSWVIEGCYADLLERVMPFSNELIFLNLPLEDCLENAKSRPWESHKYPSKSDQDANLPMLLAWIADYEDRDDTFSAQAHRALYESFSGNKCMMTARPALSRFLP